MYHLELAERVGRWELDFDNLESHERCGATRIGLANLAAHVYQYLSTVEAWLQNLNQILGDALAVV